MSDFGSITAPVKRTVTVEQVDGWRKIVSEKAVYVLPAKDAPFACHADLPSPGLLDPME